MSNSATPWRAACQASLSFTNSQNLLKLISTESMMPFNHLIICCPLLPLPLIFPSIRVFSKVSSNIGGYFLSPKVLILRWSHAFLSSISWSFTRIKYMCFSKALNPPDGEIKKRHVLRWAISAAAWKPESQWNSGHWLSSAGEQSKGRRWFTLKPWKV